MKITVYCKLELNSKTAVIWTVFYRMGFVCLFMSFIKSGFTLELHHFVV